MALTSQDGEMYAALVAASDVVVSKQLRFREPPPSLPRRQPPRAGDVARLLAREDPSFTRRVARVHSAALVYSADKEDPRLPARILHGDEQKELEALHNARRSHLHTDRSCPHCRLLHRSLYGNELPRIHVVNHSARVNVAFDPDTGVSDASIEDFQVIVPRDVALKLIRLGHPLRWDQSPSSLFRSTRAVEADGIAGEKFRGTREEVEQEWNQIAGCPDQDLFLLEDVVWPLNQDLRASSVNLLRIGKFRETATGDSLSYTYALERCVRSNFGIAWEPSGLDIDGGEFSAEAKPLRSIIRALEEYVRKPDQPNVDRLDADDQRLVQPLAKLAHLKRRDILELQASASVAHDRPKNFDEELYDGWSSQDTFQSDKVDPGKVIKSDAVDPGKVIKALRTVHEQLESKFPGETFSLLTVSASKRLHFTLPENGPVELWFFLTWMAPAILFTFLSRAICHSPHELLQQYRQERQKSSAGVPYAY